MAGNPHLPIYNSVQSRGKLYGVGAPGPLMPKDKKKGLGSKMAGALGSMFDQANESKVAQRKEQMAQLEGEFGRLEKFLSNGRFETVQVLHARKLTIFATERLDHSARGCMVMALGKCGATPAENYG